MPRTAEGRNLLSPAPHFAGFTRLRYGKWQLWHCTATSGVGNEGCVWDPARAYVRVRPFLAYAGVWARPSCLHPSVPPPSSPSSSHIPYPPLLSAPAASSSSLPHDRRHTVSVPPFVSWPFCAVFLRFVWSYVGCPLLVSFWSVHVHVHVFTPLRSCTAAHAVSGARIAFALLPNSSSPPRASASSRCLRACTMRSSGRPSPTPSRPPYSRT